jgi:ElaB/YqjD/DUF883 family membrane-anchored ribosome-binding protein
MDPKSTSPTYPPSQPIPSSASGDTMTRAEQLVDRAAQGAHQTVDQLAERAKPQLQRVEQGLEQGNEMLHRGAEQARELADEWTTSLRVTVRQHPLTAVATALLCGLLLGRVAR